ncbi:MAG: ABC-F family ATP-binding cassette domain-containing protein [Chloroflexota bacterium]|nr:ABC-F family ATP-binding cassette domain-containing protein [Chloroflexota bacterium]
MSTAVLTVHNLSKSFNIYPVFSDVTFTVNGGERVALVGPNGVGKSTVLKIIAGLEKPSTGHVVKAKGVRLVYLPQEAASYFASESDLSFSPGDALYDSMLDAVGPVRAMQDELRELEVSMAHVTGTEWEALMARYEEVTHRFEMAGGYSFEHQIDQVLQGLGFVEAQYTQTLNTMSGGQRTRAALARALLADPDVLLLDEPTNHLDIAAMEWLEGFLSSWKGTLLVIAHDRRFLNKVTTRTLDMEFSKPVSGMMASSRGRAPREMAEQEAYSRLQDYPAPYDRYLELKAERYELLTAQYEAQQEHIKKTEEFIRRFKNSQLTKQAMGRQKRLWRMERMQRPTESADLHLSLRAHVRSGRSVFEAEDLLIGYPPQDGTGQPKVLARCSDIEIERGERVGLIGPNGVGKTTLLKTMMGDLQPLGGHHELGHNVKFGYYAQAHEGLEASNTVLDEVRSVRSMTEEAARDLLAQMLFAGDNINKKVGDLSGGERSRVALTKLMLTDANFLILDEPTNHLDLDAQEALTQVLGGYDGTILFVSHDRAFIDDLASQVWSFESKQLKVWDGNYSEYVAEKARQDSPAPSTSVGPSKSSPNGNANANTGRGAVGKAQHKAPEPPKADPRDSNRANQRQDRAVQRERGKLLKQRESAEGRISTLEAQLNQVSDALTAATEARNLQEIVRLGTDYARLEQELDHAYIDWQSAEKLALSSES